ncbi:MAG TPA: NUDIX hydrolase [Minicystis sp.]|nr:NUDIX hydrolase [Minicystis sp.]
MPLPRLPRHALELLTERVEGQGGFLWLRRAELRARFEADGESEPFAYDAVGRTRLDAVVVAAHFAQGGERFVFLRSSIRPPVFLRPLDARPVPEGPMLGALWELPAGLVEEDERSPEGLRACAARELLEEIGVDVAPDRLEPLGPSSFPAPGMIGERHFYFHVEVDPGARVAPTEDGSVLERHALVAPVALAEALDLARRGGLEDAKSELALRRLAERFEAR